MGVMDKGSIDWLHFSICGRGNEHNVENVGVLKI